MVFINELKARRDSLFVYPIIWGSGYCGSKKDKGDLEYLYHSDYAARLYFDGDAPTAGARRVSEYMFRIMGNDLGAGLFPGYDIETARKIADHINCESFNFLSRKAGAIPKYPIRDGQPHFPILSVDIECPQCGNKKSVSRFHLDEKNGATTKRLMLITKLRLLDFLSNSLVLFSRILISSKVFLNAIANYCCLSHCTFFTKINAKFRAYFLF